MTELDDPWVFRCPTCGASQEPAETCRRCKSDLSLVAPLVRFRARLRGRCLRHLRAGRFAEAHRVARRACAISRDADNRRLLALTALLSGRYRRAIKIIEER